VIEKEQPLEVAALYKQIQNFRYSLLNKELVYH